MVSKGKSLELLLRLKFKMDYKNTVMEPPKQLEGVGKGKYC